MEYRKLGGSDLKVSAVGLGTWALGGDFFGDVEESRAIAAIHASLDMGVNLIDTAPAYGQQGRSESIIGKALIGKRDGCILCTKVGIQHEGDRYDRMLTPASVRAEIEISLRRLQTDYIDLYQIHWPDAAHPLEDALSELVKLREEGKVRCLGVSNFSPALLQQAIDQAGIVSCQPPYSMLDRAVEADVLPYCHEHGLGTLTYGSLSGGLLTGKFKQPFVAEGTDKRGNFYPYFVEPGWAKAQKLLAALADMAAARGITIAQLVIAWTIAQRGVTCALVGATKTSQAIDNARAGGVTLSQAELAAMDAAITENIG